LVSLNCWKAHINRMASDSPPNNQTVRPDVTIDYAGQHDTSSTLPPSVGDTSTDRSQIAEQATSKAKNPKRIASYEIQNEIGRGGMGVVYKAEDQRLKRVVALKVILAGGHAGEIELARFQTEAESVARLKHHNFVQIYEVGSDEGLPFLALEFCAGGSLEDRLEESQPTPREAAELMAKLADAMDHAHQAGVIHRDLKPGNILFDGTGDPKITDFGLAKKVGEDDSHTRTVSVMGSIGYMSPEQASGHTRDATPAVDIYALGAIFYRLLAGKTPFEGSSAVESLQLVINGVPVPIRRLRPSCPRDLDTICLKCLEKTPANRYATAADLAADLRRFLRGEPITARAATPLEQLVSWARRNPLPMMVAAGAVIMLALLAATMAWTTYRNYRVIENIQHREMRIQDLRGQILYLDEVLTNSCSLAAVTGEARWEERYRKFLPKLDDSLKQAIELVPDAESELAKVEDANTELVRLEDQAFDFVRQSQPDKAWDLLNSDKYRTNKREYALGLVSFSDRLKEHSELAIQAAHHEAMWFLIAAITLGGLVALILLIGIYSLVRVLRLQST
jgi:serine/threonine protein kinase/CHASE3 domain sensor protein